MNVSTYERAEQRALSHISSRTYTTAHTAGACQSFIRSFVHICPSVRSLAVHPRYSGLTLAASGEIRAETARLSLESHRASSHADAPSSHPTVLLSPFRSRADDVSGSEGFFSHRRRCRRHRRSPQVRRTVRSRPRSHLGVACVPRRIYPSRILVRVAGCMRACVRACNSRRSVVSTAAECRRAKVIH